MGGRAQFQAWAVPTAHTVQVGRHEVHLFRFDDVVPPESPASWLAPFEWLRCQRFRFECDRQAYLQSHWALRLVLARQLCTTPLELVLREDAYGKPTMADSGLPGFSWAHCGGRAAVVIGPREFGWGVDIERQRALPDMPALVRHQFTAAEQKAWSSLPVADREAAFFRVWTRKEATLKALGSGLLQPAHETDVGLDPDAASLDLRWAGQHHHIELWSGSPWGDLHVALAQSTLTHCSAAARST